MELPAGDKPRHLETILLEELPAVREILEGLYAVDVIQPEETEGARMQTEP